MDTEEKTLRRYDIDSLRVMVFGILIFYHVGMFFVTWGFHIKNTVIYDGLMFPMMFVNQWRIPLLFVISGMGTFYALSKRSGLQFAGERLKRLFIPLLAGMFLVVPPQVYFERLDKGQFSGSFLDFWPGNAFTGGSYPEGNISWHHLWFLPYLLIFSLALTPAFLYLRKHPQAWLLWTLRKAASKAFGLYVLAVPLFAWESLLAPYYPSTHALVGDWYNLISYCTLFFIGYLLVSLKDVFWSATEQYKKTYLLCGVVGFALFMLCSFSGGNGWPGGTYLLAFLKVFNLWSWILALIGYASVYLNKESKALRYANEAVYPFYILHQTVIVGLGYYLKDLDWGFFPKFGIMVVGTFGVTWLLYEAVIRRIPLIRPLLGLKNR